MPNRAVMLVLGYAGLMPFYGFVGYVATSGLVRSSFRAGLVVYSPLFCLLGGTLWGRVQSLANP